VERIELRRPDIRHPVTVHYDATLGREDFRSYGKRLYAFLQPRQFEIIRTDVGWSIRGFPAKNRTTVDGKDVTDSQVALSQGVRIRAGGFEVEVAIVVEEICIQRSR
jgi:hypothetical protein